MRFILVLVLASVSSLALGLSEARVTADSLNVRKNPGGELVDKVGEGQLVKLVSEKDGWSQILYLKGESENASFGWVSSDFIELRFEAENTDCIRHPDTGENHCLSTMPANLQCHLHENITESSYKGCSVEIRYELSGLAGLNEPLKVSCHSELSIKTENDSAWKSAGQSLELVFTEYPEQRFMDAMVLEFEFGEQNPAAQAQIADTRCELLRETSLAHQEHD